MDKAARGIVLSSTTQPERNLQGACHELLEIIEGQEYIIEDAQFALNYGEKVSLVAFPARGEFVGFEPPKAFEVAAREMIQKMEEVKATAQDLYDNTFNCRRARERAGLETER